jgi:hypothetical protein
LKSEKATVKRLAQLEEAKNLILKIQPLQEAIEETDERQLELQEEYRQIHERIGSLNQNYEQSANAKADKDKVAKKQGVDRAALAKERDDIRARIAKANEEIDALRNKFDTEKAAWTAWKEEAIVKHRELMEKQRVERETRFRAKEEERRAKQKAQRALRRLNPYENEIDCCNNLIRYLNEKVHAKERDREREVQRKKVASFDPHNAAPAGAKVQEHEDEWLFGDRTKDRQRQKGKAQTERPTHDDAQKQKVEKKGDKYLQHTVDRFRAFELVKVEIPMTYAHINAAVEELKKKKAEYESHIREGDAVESDEEQAAADARETD